MSTPNNTRHFCHVCSTEVPIYMAPDPTCQVCNQQFIEEIEDDADDPRRFLSGTESQPPLMNIFRSETGEGGPDENALGPFFESIMAAILGQTPMRPNGTNTPGNGTDTDGTPETGGGQENQRSPFVLYTGLVDGGNIHPIRTNMPRRASSENDSAQNRDASNQTPDGEAGNRVSSIASVMQMLQTLAGAPLDAGFVGNPNDYVFSQGALDNIISQLMEQTVGRTAPPPAPDEVIESLGDRVLTQAEQDLQVDCAVCKEEFDIKERVIELPCAHIFHNECIKPWLKMNGTCPVCRHSVVPETAGARDGSQTTNDPLSSGQATDTAADSNQSTNDTSSGNQGQQPPTSASIFSWLGGSRQDRGGSNTPSWPANIPGPFSWGPGQRRASNGHNHSPASSDNNQDHPDNDAPDLDLD
ncbi:hypothetical protein J3Q64DRAFT_1875620 [Phycomyces blakesleeanus]|uniref:RING-type domain-containing protein n=2 Tax=Phycomyces blakesleeanus TaxID=4837 RepID=A0ABR3B7K7_PHYBL